MAKVVDVIDSQLQNQGFAVGVFMDIEVAFSQVCPESIKRSMIYFNSPTVVVDRTCHMLKNRELTGRSRKY